MPPTKYTSSPCPICGTPVRKSQTDLARLKKNSKPGWMPTCSPSHAAQYAQRHRRGKLWGTNV